MNWKDRTSLLLGEEKLGYIANANVLVVGLGGVGAYAAEMICRSGVGKMTIVDGDVVEETNRNRQLVALISTQGKPKAEILKERFVDINPEIQLTVLNDYLTEDKMGELLDAQNYDYVVDAIDTLAPKIELIVQCFKRNIKILSSMGAGGKKNPSMVQVTDISKSHNCRLARQIRKRLAKLNIKKGIKVVFSSEDIQKESIREEIGRNKKSTVGTISYMPPLFGCFIASEVIKDLGEMHIPNPA